MLDFYFSRISEAPFRRNFRLNYVHKYQKKEFKTMKSRKITKVSQEKLS